jgi:hypothetical protein
MIGMSRPLRSVTLALALLPILVAVAGAANRSARTGAFQERVETLGEGFARDLDELAQWCEEHGLDHEADETRALARPAHDESSLYLSAMPREVDVKPAVGDDPNRLEWSERFHRLRVEHARDLFGIATRAFKAGQLSYSYDLVRRTAELDPDHRKARSLLGYTRYRNNWVTAHEYEMLRTGYVQHEEFGWLKRGWVKRYENGERYLQGRWISAEEEEQLRRVWDHAWELRTDHYVIRTNYDLQRGRELGQKLEHLYDVFFRTFVGFFTPRQHLNVLFEGRSPGHAERRANPFQVRYYRTKQEYVEALRGLVGNQIEISLGLYVPTERAACFFHDEEYDDDMTLWHEATHQLFFESRLPHSPSGTPQRLPGQDANFWVIEGIACYMESFRQEGDRFCIGGHETERFRAARHRALKDGFYVPLEQLTAMGIEALQSSPDIRPIYSQVAGLATFFMHYDDGRYRDALIEYLQRVYSGQDSPSTLSELTGVSYDELDEQYLEYLRGTTTGQGAQTGLAP